MIPFLIGLLIGGVLGFLIATICCVSSWASRKEENHDESSPKL